MRWYAGARARCTQMLYGTKRRTSRSDTMRGCRRLLWFCISRFTYTK